MTKNKNRSETKNQSGKNRKNAIISGISLCVLATVLGFGSMTAKAAPGFARTEDEWARLRDNRLEFEELSGLVEEYNATVRSQNLELRSFRNRYGSTSSEIADKYRETADEIMNSLSDPDPEDAAYISTLASNVQAESTVRNLRRNADELVEDYESKRLSVLMITSTLSRTAGSNMITYYMQGLDVENARLAVEKAALSLNIAEAKLKAGQGIATDVLKAQEAFSGAQAALQKAEQSREETKKKLLLMTGWPIDGQPEIAPLPEPALEKINEIRLEEDILAAIQNSYSLRIEERKLSNAQSAETQESLQNAIDNGKQNIRVVMHKNYDAVLSARDAYESARLVLEVETAARANAESKYAKGLISSAELHRVNISTHEAALAAEKAKMSLLEAMEAYESQKNGLAQITAG